MFLHSFLLPYSFLHHIQCEVCRNEIAAIEYLRKHGRLEREATWVVWKNFPELLSILEEFLSILEEFLSILEEFLSILEEFLSILDG